MGGAVLGLIGEGRGHRELDAAHTGTHQRPDLEELEADRAARGAGELRVGQADAAQGADQDIGHRGKPQPQLVGAHRVGRGAVGIEVELTFLDAVFHLAAGAVELFVKVAGLVLLAGQRGDDKARIGFAASPFRLGDDPPFAAPALARLPDEVTEAPRRFASALAVLLRRGEFGLDLSDEPTVLGQAKQEIDAVGLAPRHQRLASKTRIGTQQDAHLGPVLADLGDDPCSLLDAAGAGIDVGWTQFGRQQMPATEHVERQIAVAVVIAMEETLFLLPVQRVVGGVEVQGDLWWRRGISVDLPASGAQSARFADSLPPSTAITGSWRNWSWSIRSS